MFKLLCVVLVFSAALAADYTIWGTSGTAPYSNLSTATTTTSGKAYKITMLSKWAAALTTGKGQVTVCCATAVSDSSKTSSIKDKCLIYQVSCNQATCDGTNAATMEVKAGTSTSATAVTSGTALTTVAPTYTATGQYSGTYELTSAEAMSLGLPDSMSPKYKVDITCHTEDKSSGQTVHTTISTKPTGNEKKISIGTAGAFSSFVSMIALGSVAVAYSMF